jgi:hypothetical protein
MFESLANVFTGTTPAGPSLDPNDYDGGGLKPDWNKTGGTGAGGGSEYGATGGGIVDWVQRNQSWLVPVAKGGYSIFAAAQQGKAAKKAESEQQAQQMQLLQMKQAHEMQMLQMKLAAAGGGGGGGGGRAGPPPITNQERAAILGQQLQARMAAAQATADSVAKAYR